MVYGLNDINLGLTSETRHDDTFSKSAFPSSPLSCYYIPTTFPIYDWESGGKEVESGRKRYEVVALGRTSLRPNVP